jgi:transcriptional regulator with XRE-family HTH domain
MATHYKPTADEVRGARLFAKLTQQQSADMCQVTANTWARYEQGLTQMPAPVWKLFEYALTLQEIHGKKIEKKVTVYEQRKLDREAEAQRQAELEAKYAQKVAEREQEEMDRREELLPRFDELMGKLRKRFGHVIKDFENYEQSHELAMAIHHMEKMYTQYKDEIEAMNNGTYVEESWADEEFKGWML